MGFAVHARSPNNSKYECFAHCSENITIIESPSASFLTARSSDSLYTSNEDDDLRRVLLLTEHLEAPAIACAGCRRIKSLTEVDIVSVVFEDSG